MLKSAGLEQTFDFFFLNFEFLLPFKINGEVNIYFIYNMSPWALLFVYKFTFLIVVYFHQSMLAMFSVFMVCLLLQANGRGLTHWKL